MGSPFPIPIGGQRAHFFPTEGPPPTIWEASFKVNSNIFQTTKVFKYQKQSKGLARSNQRFGNWGGFAKQAKFHGFPTFFPPKPPNFPQFIGAFQIGQGFSLPSQGARFPGIYLNPLSKQFIVSTLGFPFFPLFFPAKLGFPKFPKKCFGKGPLQTQQGS